MQFQPMPLEDAIRAHIFEMLRVNGWNRTKTAKALGISIRGLRMKLQMYRDRGWVIPENPKATIPKKRALHPKEAKRKEEVDAIWP